jgi:hypothetical protein
MYSSVQAAVLMLFHRYQNVTDTQTCFQNTCLCLIKKCQSDINGYAIVFHSFFCSIRKSSDLQFSVVEPEMRTNTQPHIALWTLKKSLSLSLFFFGWNIHSTKFFFYLRASVCCDKCQVQLVCWWNAFLFPIGLSRHPYLFLREVPDECEFESMW